MISPDLSLFNPVGFILAEAEPPFPCLMIANVTIPLKLIATLQISSSARALQTVHATMMRLAASNDDG